MESKRERQIYIFLLMVLCLISLGLCYYIFKKEHLQEIRPVPVNESITLNAVPIVPEDVSVVSSYVGYIEAINQVQIIPYITGYIKDVTVQPGQNVHSDELLLTIDPDEYKARLDAAKAAVLQAEASFQYNQNYYERVQKSGKKAFSEIEIDNAKNNFLQAQASLKNAQANKILAEVNYDYTIIKAPINGMVGNFTLSSGDYVTPNGTALFTIIQTNPIRVVFSLTDREYFDLKSGDTLFKNSVIRLKLPNGKIYEYAGEFKYTNNEINKSTNSLAVYSYFENPKNELLPNAYVTVEVQKIFKNSVLVNKDFVKMQTDGDFLAISHNNQIIKQKIEILSDHGNQYVLNNTFGKDDLLILDDTSNIPQNAKIDFKIIQ